MPPASIGALSGVYGEGCGRSGVAHDVDGAGRGKRSRSWITVVVMIEIRTPASFLEATKN
jgi:hypothetical protein